MNKNKKKIGFLTLLFFFSAFSSSIVSANVLELIEQHFLLADPMTTELAYENLSTQNQHNSDIWFILQESEDFMQTDLTQLLNTDMRESVLNDYISDGKNLIQGLDYHYNQHSVELQSSQSILNTCKSQLSTANTTYESALSSNNENLYTSAILQAKQARSCLGEQSVAVNALQNLNKKISSYRSAIQKRTSYLDSNKNLIVNNYAMLDTKKLSELQNITSALNSTRQ